MSTRYPLRLLILISLGLIYNPTPLLAQLIPDDTLGIENSVVTPQQLRDLIEGGAIRGGNLFHSFSEFNVNEGQQVFFANPVGILNILTRVTGINTSDIFGTLGVEGAANLILINPNGINFGANASLDVSGSFFATTADSIIFDNGFEFSARNPEAPPPLLIVNLPSFFSFLENQNPGKITVNGNLEMNDGQNIALLGGDVIVTNAEINARGGNVFLGGLTSAGNIQISSDGSIIFPEGVARGDVSLIEESKVNVAAPEAGSISINAANLVISEGSELTAGIKVNQGDVSTQAGDININATGDIAVLGTISNNSPKDGDNPSGNAGNITISGNNIELEGGTIESTIKGAGNGGDINITANGALNLTSISEPTRIQAIVDSEDAKGDGGDINLNAASISLDERSQIIALTSSQVMDVEAAGDGGDINITTGSFTITEGGDLIARTEGNGRGGNITITATGAVSLVNGGSGINANNNNNKNLENAGDSGDITITANSLLLQSEIDAKGGNQPFIRTINAGTGRPGKITINTDTITLNGANDGGIFGINAQTRSSGDSEGIEINTRILTLNNRGKIQANVNRSGATGNSGDIVINAESISLINKSQISSSTDSIEVDPTQGNAGDIIITTNSLEVIGQSSSINTQVNSPEDKEPSTSQGGNIIITTNSLSLIDGGNLDSSTEGIGDAGNISVTVTESVIISGIDGNRRSSGIFSSTQESATGKAGSINLQVPEGFLRISDGGVIDAQTRGSGKEGSIIINVETLELLTGGQIITSSFSDENAGDITITASEEILISGFDSGFNERLEFAENVLAAGVTESISDLITNDFNDSIAPSGIFARTQSSGNAGKIEITTPNLTIENSAQITAATEGEGNSGEIQLSVDDTLLIEGIDSGIFSTAEINSTGKTGSITINSQQLTIRDNGEISVDSEGSNIGGNIEINANNITLDEGKISSETRNSDASNITAESNSTEETGSITINSQQLTILSNGEISVDSESSNIGGDIEINANNITLDEGNISSETLNSDGGNITLNIANLLLLQNDSSISTNAGTAQASGTGGNIIIDAPLIVAVPDANSDISANAFTGDGGRVEITADGIFGIEFREQSTTFSDITASSEQGNAGIVELNTPDTNPAETLTALPTNLVDASRLIVRSCATDEEELGRFVVTGRGGLPANPREKLSDEILIDDWIILWESSANQENVNVAPVATNQQIIEARGWSVAANGKIILTAEATPETVGQNQLAAYHC